MPTISPFPAMRPVNSSLAMEFIRFRLEPQGTALEQFGYAHCREYLTHLLDSESYMTGKPAIYLYGYTPKLGRPSLGIWAVTNAQDFKTGNIISCEMGSADRAELAYEYRKTVGMEGSPVLIGYEQDDQLSELINLVLSSKGGRSFRDEQGVHEIWKINREHLIEKFRAAFSRLSSCYLIEGKDRVLAALQLQQERPQWLSSLYLSMEQLRFSAVHRLVQGNQVDRTLLMRCITSYYYLTYIPSNRPYRPEARGQIGLFFSGIWYKLEPIPYERELLERPECVLLQQRILSPAFGIVEPADDQRLRYFGNAAWEDLLSELSKDPCLIAFTLFPMDSAELIRSAKLGMDLPVHSLGISPKSPFGILMHELSNDSQKDRKNEGETAS